MITPISYASGLTYQNLIKPILFKIDPELVHVHMVRVGQLCGQINIAKQLLQTTYAYKDPMLTQKIAGITFANPIGLAAGFDYEARLTQVLASIGFGFGTVGTITNVAYQGNSRPMLGRLPKSLSLMVNKGFKNEGAKTVVQKLSHLHFPYPVGISVGRTNSLQLKTQKQSITDITSAFRLFEQSNIKHAYYELNISCPNLLGHITFYPPKNLRKLLTEIKKLQLTKPVFIKMPIEKTNKEFESMLDVVTHFPIAGVIIGNLQKNHQDPALDPVEVKKFDRGHFSGKPCWNRSNELITLTHKHYGKKLMIIGCGGVFSAEDAYIKIKLGASLVQLITGMIFEGPQVIGQINQGLVQLLKRDGLIHISEAVGVER